MKIGNFLIKKQSTEPNSYYSIFDDIDGKLYHLQDFREQVDAIEWAEQYTLFPSDQIIAKILKFFAICDRKSPIAENGLSPADAVSLYELVVRTAHKTKGE